VPAFRRICSARFSSFYISALRALELGALDEIQKTFPPLKRAQGTNFPPGREGTFG
jgi:hypothetical protein